jgi:hypothetical protein
MPRGLLIYAATAAVAGQMRREGLASHPGSRIAVFSAGPIDDLPVDLADFVRVRPRVDPRADLAACRVAYPSARWSVWGSVPQSALSQPLPVDTDGTVDVLSILGRFPTWVEYRGCRQRDFLAAAGIRHGWTHARDLVALTSEIARREPRVVLNEVWMISPDDMAALATQFPGVQFVALTHGTPAWISTERAGEHYAFLHLSRERGNCHYGHVMAANRCVSLPGSKIVSLPNFVAMPADLPQRESGPPTVSLIARDTETKQWGAAVAAVALAAQRIPDLHVLLGDAHLKAGIDPHIGFFGDLGIPTVTVKWGRWEDYLDRVARSVDCHLTATLAESFCLVPLEHCLLGRPVAGTPAVEWLPARWQRNPQAPAALASTLVSHFEDYTDASARALGVAQNVAARNHRHLLASLQRLLG